MFVTTLETVGGAVYTATEATEGQSVTQAIKSYEEGRNYFEGDVLVIETREVPAVNDNFAVQVYIDRARFVPQRASEGLAIEGVYIREIRPTYNLSLIHI